MNLHVLLLIILPGDLCRLVSETVGLAMLAKKKLIISTSVYILWACLYLGFAALLLPEHGLMGVATAYLLSQICNTLMVFFVTWRSIDYRPDVKTLLTLIRGGILVTVMVVLTWNRPDTMSGFLIGMILLLLWGGISWFDPRFRTYVILFGTKVGLIRRHV